MEKIKAKKKERVERKKGKSGEKNKRRKKEKSGEEKEMTKIITGYGKHYVFFIKYIKLFIY